MLGSLAVLGASLVLTVGAPTVHDEPFHSILINHLPARPTAPPIL